MTDLSDDPRRRRAARRALPPAPSPLVVEEGRAETGPDWERAHEICQASEGEPAYDRVHALAHWIEGDRSNADYWYRRSGAARSGADPAEEWASQVADLGGKP